MANTGASKPPSESTCRPDRAGSILPKQTGSVAKQTKSLRRYVAVTDGGMRGSIGTRSQPGSFRTVSHPAGTGDCDVHRTDVGRSVGDSGIGG
jgi:hypothetical protein